MAKYRKKPVVIEAFQYPRLDSHEDAFDDFLEWAHDVGLDVCTSADDGCLRIKTLEGVMTAQPGDWIIKGVKGEFYPCKPDIFSATYQTEPVTDSYRIRGVSGETPKAPSDDFKEVQPGVLQRDTFLK